MESKRIDSDNYKVSAYQNNEEYFNREEHYQFNKGLVHTALSNLNDDDMKRLVKEMFNITDEH